MSFFFPFFFIEIGVVFDTFCWTIFEVCYVYDRIKSFYVNYYRAPRYYTK